MKPTAIVIHHSLTKDSETASWPVIRENHKKENYSDIGYHFGIENIRGQIELIVGRLPNEKGAHVKGFNDNSIGICVIGNFDNEPPPEEYLSVLRKLIKYLMGIYHIETICGHRELDPKKSCPGKMFDIDKLRSDVLGSR